MNPLQNKSQGDAQKNLAHAEAKQANAKTEPENAKIIIATHHTHSEEATEFAQSGQKSGLFAKLPAQLRTCGQIVNDLIFRFRVKQCPNKELRKLSADAKQIRRSPLFDRLWYCSHYKKQIRPTQNAIYHYLLDGAALGFNPSPSFNTLGYLDLYPDVAAAKVNPLLHYLRIGKRERRVPNVPSCEEALNEAMQHCAAQFARLDPSKKTALLVTHQMSRTGAPILLLNIAKEVKKKLNVIILTLRNGPLESEFTATCDVLIGTTLAPEHLNSEKFFSLLFKRIESRTPVAFAVINSIVSHVVLRPLWENDIPSIHLIHEFASYTRPRGLYRKSAFYSSVQIFPAALVRDSAVVDCLEIRTGNSIILPQGINSAPGITHDPTLAAAEQQHIRDVFRPAGFPSNTVVIVGMGTVELRKGVDLFIACAKRVAEKCPATPFRFVWIGQGYDPECDQYSLFLADQIQRSGIEALLTITHEVDEIDTAYQESDILFLSSRLDPLPLVSQDSIANARPVVCFKDGTGIAEYLAENADAAFGVVPYLDIEEAANRICRLIDDGDYRKKVGAASQKLAASHFCFESYISRIESIGLELGAKKTVEKADRDLISKSNLFRPDFYCSPGHLHTQEAPLRQYMNGIWPRKPLPGFHPGVYADCNHVTDRDPLAHYIEAGQPEGPWRYELIEEDGQPAAEKSVRVGLHLHLYFPDLANDIFERFKKLHTPIDLLISVPSAEVARTIETMAKHHAKGQFDIRVVPNRGRDIGPFLTEFGDTILSNYDIIGHLHTKKSIDVDNRASIQDWINFLYGNLLAGETRMADTIIRRMTADQTIGLVFPDDPNLIGWGQNWTHAAALADRLNIAKSLPKTSINFPVGTMFWTRTAALEPLFKLGLKWDDYPPEPLPYDGSPLHAFERILPFVVERCGYRNAVTNVKGLTR